MLCQYSSPQPMLQCLIDIIVSLGGLISLSEMEEEKTETFALSARCWPSLGESVNWKQSAVGEL